MFKALAAQFEKRYAEPTKKKGGAAKRRRGQATVFFTCLSL
jgi:hypothetical protein